MIRPRNVFLVATSLAILIFVNCTTILVDNIGRGSVVHRSAYSSATTSVDGIYSFWKSMHDFNDKGISHRQSPSLQYPNMGVVPDLINSADGGLVIGIVQNFVDMSLMPTISNCLKGNGAVGHLHVDGSNVESIIKNINSQVVDSTSFEKSFVKKFNSLLHGGVNKLESIVVKLEDNASSIIVDSAFERVLQIIKKETSITGKTIVIYIIVDEKVDSHYQYFMSRGLSEDNNAQDENEEGENRNEEEEKDEENKNEEEEGNEENKNEEEEGNEEENQQDYNNNEDFQAQSTFGYLNDYGEWITTYKSMFHIQYSNIVLWTSVILILSVIISTGMMIYMPLMPDTLLFGESAKMVVE